MSSDLEEKQERCVPKEEAAWNPSGNCIIASDSTCDGEVLCESSSNCYWERPVHGEPRQRRYTDEEADAVDDYLYGTAYDSYAVTVAKYFVAGIVLGVLNLLIWVIFVIGRCCCCCLWEKCICRCCSPRPKEQGYSLCFQVRVPIFCYIFFIAGIGASAFVTYIGNEDITVALSDTFKHSREGLEDMQGFIGDAATPMIEIKQLVVAAANDSIAILDDTEYVSYGMGKVVDSLNDFATVVYADGVDKAGAGDSVGDTLSELDSSVQPIVDEIQTMLDTLQSALVDGRDDLKKTIGGAINNVLSLNDTLSDGHEKIDEYDEMVGDYSDLRRAGVLAIFAVALGCCVFGMIGISSYWTPCKWDDILIHLMNITWFIGSFIVTLTWILAGLTLFLSVFWSDVCQFLDIVVDDFEPYVGYSAAKGANACFQNTPLVEAFNLTSRINFQEEIDTQLEELNNMDIDAQFAAVAEPIEQINDLVKAIPVVALVNALNSTTNVVESSILTDSQEDGGVGLSQADADTAKETCPFNDLFTAADLDLLEEPWTINANQGNTGNTAWLTYDTGVATSYARQGTETGAQYMARIYNAAGLCTGGPDPITDPKMCSLGPDNNVQPPNYVLDPDAVPPPCNGGDGCSDICGPITALVTQLYAATVDTMILKENMLIDLGVDPCPTGKQCPTQAFIDAGNGKTVMAFVDAYKSNLTTTMDSLLGVTDSAVGDIMEQVRIFLCNMNCGFVAEAWDNIHTDFCTTLLGGVLQISISLWLLAVCLFVNCLLGAVLVVRMRGVSTEEAEEELDGVEMKGVTLDIYN